MTPDLDLLRILIALIIPAVILLWMIPSPCRCEKCGFHVNERRMAALKQAEVSHEAQHKGFGYGLYTPDRYDCNDAACPRNASNRPNE